MWLEICIPKIFQQHNTNKMIAKQANPFLKKGKLGIILNLKNISKITVIAPTANTTKSVKDVIVIATPACFKVSPTNKSMVLSANFGSESSKFDKHWTITNMSSIPIPNSRDDRIG